MRVLLHFVITINSPNFDNHSKILAFKKSKRLLHKYCLRFAKICKNSAHLNHFLLILHDCIPNLSQSLSIGKLLKNANPTQLGTVESPTTAFHSEITKPKIF